MPRSAPKKCSLNFSKGVWGRSTKAAVSRPVTGSGCMEPDSFTCVLKPSAVRITRYLSPGFGSPMYTPPEIGPEAPSCRGTAVPTFENSGHLASLRVPKRASASEHETFPSAALEFSDNPSGSVILTVLICEGEGVTGSWVWGTVSVTSRPDGASVSSVVGFALRLGLKDRRSQPVVAGHAASAVSTPWS